MFSKTSIAKYILLFVAFSASAIALDKALNASEPETEAAVPVVEASTQDAIFVGNNWDGMIDVIDANTYERIGRINGIPDHDKRLEDIKSSTVRYGFFLAIKNFVGEGNNQYVDDMYSSNDGRLLVVSRPSFADVVALDIATGEIVWRFPVSGYRSDHMAVSPDGKNVAVSASTANLVHILDIETGKEIGTFSSGDSPHENMYSEDGSKIFHASIGRVFTPLDRGILKFTKGDRLFKIVNAKNFETIKEFDLGDKLKEAELGHLSPAVRPMAHTSDERFFYFQLSFLHGFVEFDMEKDEVTRLVELPNMIPDVPIEKYINDSAHHGIAMSGDDKKLCVAGTMDDYVAIVDRSTFEYKLLQGLGEKPYWVTKDKTGTKCYISWSETDQMSVISFAEEKEIKRIDVGDHPQRIREGVVPKGWKTTI